MDIATLPVALLKSQGDNGEMTFVASTDRVDRMGDIIAQKWDLRSFRQTGGPFLYGHRHSDLPIGKVTRVWTERASESDEATRRTMIQVRFAPADLHPFAEQVKRFYEAGYLKSVSVGFRPKKIKQLSPDEKQKLGMPSHGLYFEESELLEVSAVPIPANPDATIAEAEASLIAELQADEGMVVRRGAAPDRLEEWAAALEREADPPATTSAGGDWQSYRLEVRQPSMKVQSLVFAKSNWTEASAKKWAKDHDFHAGKVDVTEDSIRLRQFEPSTCQKDSFRSKPVPGAKGVTMVMCRKRSEAAIAVDALRDEIRTTLDPLRVLTGMADAVERIAAGGRTTERVIRAMLQPDQTKTLSPSTPDDESEADEVEDDLDESALEEALDLIE